MIVPTQFNGFFLKRIKHILILYIRKLRFLARLLYTPLSRISVDDTLEYFNASVQDEKKYLLAYKTESIIIEKPEYINLENLAKRQVYSFVSFIMSLPTARYYHEHPSIITKEGIQLAIVSNHPELGQNEHALFHQLYLSKPKRFRGKGLILSTPNDNNYYHCLFQIAPKLWKLEEQGFNIDEIDYFFIEFSAYNFQQEILGIVEFDKKKLINLRHFPHIQVEQMFVTSPYWRPEPWICSKLRNAFLKVKPSGIEPRKKIFVSRNKANYRRICNENELVEYLKSKDVEIFNMEGMTVREQAEVFSNSDVVISAHGAALSNIVFCTPGTKILEFRVELHQDNLGNVFEHISSICGLNHYTFMCKGFKNDNESKAKFWDLQVDIPNVSNLLNKMLLQ